MKISLTRTAVSLYILSALNEANAAFSANVPSTRTTPSCSRTVLKGYLDDLTADLYAESNDPDIEATSKEATDMSKDQIDRYGPGAFDQYVEFDEFDGGDGQMGVAGDGNSKLEKFGGFSDRSVVKSKSMSAKNAWGTSTGYADSLIDKGIDTQKAQRMENWQNQRAVREKQLAQKAQLDALEKMESNADEDWRVLAKFGVERNQQFDLNETFGAVVVGASSETISLRSQIGRVAIHEFKLRNDYMGFADFRAAFTADSNQYDWQVLPEEGSLQSTKDVDFVVRFKPNNPGVSEATLVIDTEDMKKTYKFIGTTA